MNLVERIKRIAKKSVVIPFFVGAALIAGCNQNTVPVCENNPATEYAKEIGFTDLEAKIFSPLGLDCEITGENVRDKEAISFIKEMYDSGNIGLSQIERIMEKFGEKDETGKDYTISEAEFNAMKYAYYHVYSEFKKVDENIKFDSFMIKGFVPMDIGFRLNNVDTSMMGYLSFPIVTPYDLSNDGKKDNFMSLEGVLVPGSNTICPDLVEIMREGYDLTIESPSGEDGFFVNTTFTTLKLVRQMKELKPDGSWRFPQPSYTLTFSPIYRDSSLYPENFIIILAHAYNYKDSNGENKAYEVEDNYTLEGLIINDDGSIVTPNKIEIVKIIYDANAKDIDEDYNYLEENSALTIPEQYERFTTGILEGKTFYYTEIYDPRRPLGIFPTTNVTVSEVDENNKIYILDLTKAVSGPGVVSEQDPNYFVCKVKYNFY